MGCDIHSIAQVRKNGKWETVTAKDELVEDRSYVSFGMLAGVRSGLIETPISKPRGLPEDFEMGLDENEYHEGIWLGDHSYSWLLLKEIKDYTWDKTIPQSTIVVESEFLRLIKERVPYDQFENHYRFLNSKDYRVVSVDEYKKLYSDPDRPLQKLEGTLGIEGEIAVRVEWGESYKTAGFVYDTLIPQLEDLAKLHGVSDTDIRYVFGFDS